MRISPRYNNPNWYPKKEVRNIFCSYFAFVILKTPVCQPQQKCLRFLFFFIIKYSPLQPKLLIRFRNLKFKYPKDRKPDGKISRLETLKQCYRFVFDRNAVVLMKSNRNIRFSFDLQNFKIMQSYFQLQFSYHRIAPNAWHT